MPNVPSAKSKVQYPPKCKLQKASYNETKLPICCRLHIRSHAPSFNNSKKKQMVIMNHKDSKPKELLCVENKVCDRLLLPISLIWSPVTLCNNITLNQITDKFNLDNSMFSTLQMLLPIKDFHSWHAIAPYKSCQDHNSKFREKM